MLNGKFPPSYPPCGRDEASAGPRLRRETAA
jgi:hypothetical protein